MRGAVCFHIGADNAVLEAGARGPEFLAVDDVAVAIAHGVGADVADIRARVGFGNADAKLDRSVEQLRQPVGALRVGALAQHVEAAKNAAAKGHADIRRDARQFIDDDRQIDRRRAEAADILREWQAQQARVGPGLIEFLGVFALALPFAQRFAGRVLRHQLDDAVAQHLLFLGEREFHPSLSPNPRQAATMSASSASAPSPSA